MPKPATLPFVPRLLKAPLAAAYLGMSETKFRELVARGRIAKPSDEDGLVLWDVRKLDDYADSLQERQPYASMGGLPRAV